MTVKASDYVSADDICKEFDDSITEADAGKTFRYVETSRFGFCLNESKYPLKNLDISDCRSVFGYVSNLSPRGPNNYPIGFEILGAGSCVVRNGTFNVRMVGTELK
jgi:hypothetical protein